MDRIECDVIQDLIPLYIDGACSQKTKEEVQLHLDGCDKCNRIYDEMNAPIGNTEKNNVSNEGAGLVKLRRKIIAFIIVILVMGMGIGLNFAAMRYGDRTLAPHAMVSILYAIFWLVFTYKTRDYKGLQKLSVVVGALSMLTAFKSILVFSFGTEALQSIFSSFLPVSFLTPLYGLSVFGDFLPVALMFSLIWTGLASYNIVKTGETNFFNQVAKKEDNTILTKRRHFLTVIIVAFAYALIYFVSQKYLYNIYTAEWTSRQFLPIAAIISIIPALRKSRYSPYISLSGYVIGVILGELFGPTERIMDKSLPPMPIHQGWFIAIVTFLIFSAIGAILEMVLKKRRISKEQANSR